MERGRTAAGQTVASVVFSRRFCRWPVALAGALISLCSQSGSHGRQERGEGPMGPSQRAESSREAETDNGITADANDSAVLLLVITLTFWL